MVKAEEDAEGRGWKVSEEKNEFYKKDLAEKGMKIMKPSPKLVADLRQVGGILKADWVQAAGAAAKATLAALEQSHAMKNSTCAS